MKDFLKNFYVTTSYVEKELGIKKNTQYRLIRKGIFPGVKIRGRWYIRKNFFYKYQTPLF